MLIFNILRFLLNQLFPLWNFVFSLPAAGRLVKLSEIAMSQKAQRKHKTHKVMTYYMFFNIFFKLRNFNK